MRIFFNFETRISLLQVIIQFTKVIQINVSHIVKP